MRHKKKDKSTKKKLVWEDGSIGDSKYLPKDDPEYRAQAFQDQGQEESLKKNLLILKMLKEGK